MKDFIGVFDNEDMNEFCDFVIQMFEDAKSQNGVKSRQQEDPEISKTEKDDLLVFTNDFANGHEVHDYFYNLFWSRWYKEYAKEYGVLSNLGWHSGLEFKMQRTDPGQGYHVWHCEAAGIETSERILSWILYLNDVEDGGETEFLYQHRRVKPKKGRVVIWPAAFTHTHRGNPPLSGTKYIATGWVTYQEKPDEHKPG